MEKINFSEFNINDLCRTSRENMRCKTEIVWTCTEEIWWVYWEKDGEDGCSERGHGSGWSNRGGCRSSDRMEMANHCGHPWREKPKEEVDLFTIGYLNSDFFWVEVRMWPHVRVIDSLELSEWPGAADRNVVRVEVCIQNEAAVKHQTRIVDGCNCTHNTLTYTMYNIVPKQSGVNSWIYNFQSFPTSQSVNQKQVPSVSYVAFTNILLISDT